MKIMRVNFPNRLTARHILEASTLFEMLSSVESSKIMFSPENGSDCNKSKQAVELPPFVSLGNEPMKSVFDILIVRCNLCWTWNFVLRRLVTLNHTLTNEVKEQKCNETSFNIPICNNIVLITGANKIVVK